MITEVNTTEMSCILLMCKDLEKLPEPFRMQDNVTFLVSYQKYCDYLLTLRPRVDDYLCRPIEDLQKLVRDSSPILFNRFLEDMSYAIMRELHFSQAFAGKPTMLLPKSNNAMTMTIDECNVNFQHAYKEEKWLLTTMARNEYPVSVQNLSQGKSLMMYRLAVSLYYLSTSEKAVVEFSLLAPTHE